ncbi:MAG: hypothetical protein ABIE74_02370 [Pseudomonadota bacterium]
MLTEPLFKISTKFGIDPFSQRAKRIEEKQLFEEKIAQLKKNLNADLIIIDHLMLCIENLVQTMNVGGYGLYGEMLNVHPGITSRNNVFRLPGKQPTQNAINRANGFKIEHGKIKNITPHFRTGASLHFAGLEIDNGPVIADIEGTPVYKDDEAEWLRVRNYQMGKFPVFFGGMVHFYSNIWGHILEAKQEGNLDNIQTSCV